MTWLEIILVGISLAMDAFAVSICKGLEMPKFKYGQALIIALMFGIFQGLMPILGWLLGSQFSSYIAAYDHWIAFVLLALIGLKMIYDGTRDDEEVCQADKFRIGQLFVLAIATSIDALAVGITFAFFQVKIFAASSVIALITFAICMAGIIIGNKFGNRFKNKAEMIGGIILILIGIKIVLSHLGFLPF